MARIHDDITSTIGATPLVRLGRMTEGIAEGASVLAKLESANPGGSVKDRLALAIIETAEADGSLQPGGIIVEGTSGNTGIGLAMAGAAKGYRVILAMPDTMSTERRALLRAYGAELVLTPGADGMRGAVERARRIVDETPGAILARQFETPANARIHRETTAPEIWEDAGGKVDVLVAAIGTGGTVTGVGQALKERNPDLIVIGVEPADSPILTTGKAGPHKIQGIGANFVPDVLDRDVLDSVTDVELDDALRTARRLAEKEGILAGMSSGANVWAALEVAKRPEMAGKTIVTFVCDTGERYLSTVLFDDLRDA